MNLKYQKCISGESERMSSYQSDWILSDVDKNNYILFMTLF